MNRKTYRDWTPQEDDALRAAWEAAGETVSIRGTAGRIDQHIAATTGHTIPGVQSRRRTLGITCEPTGTDWTPDEDALVAAGHLGGDQAIADILGRTTGAVRHRRTLLRARGVDCVRHGLPGGTNRSPGPIKRKKRKKKPTPPTSSAPPAPKTEQAPSVLPRGWYGPPGSGHGRGEAWVPGQAFRRTA